MQAVLYVVGLIAGTELYEVQVGKLDTLKGVCICMPRMLVSSRGSWNLLKTQTPRKNAIAKGQMCVPRPTHHLDGRIPAGRYRITKNDDDGVLRGRGVYWEIWYACSTGIHIDAGHTAPGENSVREMPCLAPRPRLRRPTMLRGSRR